MKKGKGPRLKFILRLLVILSGILIGLLSCLGEGSETAPSKIDYEKVDALFGHDVSQLLFDHLYIVLDSVSYAQLTQRDSLGNTYGAMDKGLPDFAAIDKRTTSCYLRGHKHYIELLGPDNTYQEPIGKSGVGFSLQNSREHFHLGVEPKLKQSGTPYLSISETVDMPVGKQEATWFKAFYSPSEDTALHTWYAFYNPAFLDSLYPEKHPDYSREAFLRKSYKEEQLFEGIKNISLECTPKDYERIAQEMRHLGCNLLKKEGQTLTIASGDVTITITPSNAIAYSRILKIECRLNTIDHSITYLGNLIISNQGTESVWDFEGLYKNNIE